MNRLLVLLFVTGLAVTTVPVGTVGAQQSNTGAYIGVTNVTFTPQNPAPGESVTVRATIENLRDSAGVVEINSVALTNPNSAGELARVSDVGSVAPGSSLTVPLTTTFENGGTKNLRIDVYGTGPDGNSVHVRYPATVTVETQHPQLDIETNETAAGTDGTGTITVANGLSTAVTNVDVELTSDQLKLTDDRFVVASIDSGKSATESFDFKSESPGTYPLTATMHYRVGESTRRTTTQTVSVEIERLRDNVILEASSESDSSTIDVDVLNRGNVPIENVTISGRSANASIPTKLVSKIADGESVTRHLNATLDGNRADVHLTASYDIADKHGQASDSVTISSMPGTIELTGVDIQPENGKLRVTGSASNVGSSGAQGVIVRVADTDTVSPAAPNREYFVGSVPASDFVSFEVYARTEGNVSEIPLEVTYRADGRQYRRTVTVPVEGATNQTGQQVQKSSSGLLVPAIGGLVVLVIAAIIYRSWRASRASP